MISLGVLFAVASIGLSTPEISMGDYDSDSKRFDSAITTAGIDAVNGNALLEQTEWNFASGRTNNKPAASNPTGRNVPWNIDRLDSYSSLDGVFSVKETGYGSTIYILDSGVRGDHKEFSGRVEKGYSYFSDLGGNSDCNGHGTNVAGVAAGASKGIASQATIVPVTILDCKGDGGVDGLIAALLWIEQDSETRKGAKLVNISLGGYAGVDADRIISRLFSKGIGIVAASGNDASNECTRTITRVSEAVIVSAVKKHEVYFKNANSGKCVDLLAPGYFIESSSNSSVNKYEFNDGTSLAAPHVAGAAALIAERFNVSGAEALEILISTSIQREIPGLPENTSDRLLYIPNTTLPLSELNIDAATNFVSKISKSSTGFKASQLKDLSSLKFDSANITSILNDSGESVNLARIAVLNSEKESAKNKTASKTEIYFEGKVIYGQGLGYENPSVEYVELPLGKAYTVVWSVLNAKGKTIGKTEVGFILSHAGFNLTSTQDALPFKVRFSDVINSKVRVSATNIPAGSKVQIFTLDKHSDRKEIAWQNPTLKNVLDSKNKLVRTIKVSDKVKSIIVVIDGIIYERFTP